MSEPQRPDRWGNVPGGFKLIFEPVPERSSALIESLKICRPLNSFFPSEIHGHIWKFLDHPSDVLTLGLVCKEWRQMLEDYVYDDWLKSLHAILWLPDFTWFNGLSSKERFLILSRDFQLYYYIMKKLNRIWSTFPSTGPNSYLNKSCISCGNSYWVFSLDFSPYAVILRTALLKGAAGPSFDAEILAELPSITNRWNCFDMKRCPNCVYQDVEL